MVAADVVFFESSPLVLVFIMSCVFLCFYFQSSCSVQSSTFQVKLLLFKPTLTQFYFASLQEVTLGLPKQNNCILEVGPTLLRYIQHC